MALRRGRVLRYGVKARYLAVGLATLEAKLAIFVWRLEVRTTLGLGNTEPLTR